jgi:RimJ/RimL family protein N-acetyltransferase
MGGTQLRATAFELQPRISGLRVDLRPMTLADWGPLLAAASDPLIWEQHPESDRWKPEVFRRYFDGGMASGGALVVIDRANRRIIGSSRYCNLDAAASEVEIGWTFLERRYWGGTFNREMKMLMLGHAFRFVHRVVFVVGEHNLRSQKALEKIGARFLRRMDEPEPERVGGARVVFAIDRAGSEAAVRR